MIPVLSIVGYSNSGKTTLIMKLITELKKRNYRVAVIKHHGGDFDIDCPGKDTWRHARAGADTVVMASPGKVAVIEKTLTELSLDAIIEKLTDVDIIITEGFKRENKPKIEVFRSEVHTSLITPPEQLLAVAADANFENIPTFGLEDAQGLVDFLINALKLMRGI